MLLKFMLFVLVSMVSSFNSNRFIHTCQSFKRILIAIRKKTTLMKIINMAKKLKVDKKLEKDLLLLQNA